MARPSKFTEELVTAICERLSVGEPLAQICRDEGMPGLRTVYDWVEGMPDVSARIARAREAGEDVIAADCLSIADDGRRDYEVSEDGGATVNHDHIQRSKLRIDTRLKLLAKWNPKKYGDRQSIEHSGPGGKPIQIATAMTDEQLGAVVAAG
jgi:hypothetical protein